MELPCLTLYSFYNRKNIYGGRYSFNEKSVDFINFLYKRHLVLKIKRE